MKAMCKVIAQTQPVAVQKQDGSTIQKGTIVVQEIDEKWLVRRISIDGLEAGIGQKVHEYRILRLILKNL